MEVYIQHTWLSAYSTQHVCAKPQGLGGLKVLKFYFEVVFLRLNCLKWQLFIGRGIAVWKVAVCTWSCGRFPSDCTGCSAGCCMASGRSCCGVWACGVLSFWGALGFAFCMFNPYVIQGRGGAVLC